MSFWLQMHKHKWFTWSAIHMRNYHYYITVALDRVVVAHEFHSDVILHGGKNWIKLKCQLVYRHVIIRECTVWSDSARNAIWELVRLETGPNSVNDQIRFDTFFGLFFLSNAFDCLSFRWRPHWQYIYKQPNTMRKIQRALYHCPSSLSCPKWESRGEEKKSNTGIKWVEKEKI